MNKTCTLGELDAVLAELAEQEDYFPDEIMIEEEEGESAIFVNDVRILLPTLDLELREGLAAFGRRMRNSTWKISTSPPSIKGAQPRRIT